jgi:hypothetical protein
MIRTLLAVLLLVACSTSGAGSSSGTGGGNGGRSVTISGTGIQKSAPFHLTGSYSVSWSAQAATDIGCAHAAFLARTDGTSTLEMLVNQMISDAQPHSGSTNVYNLADAQYYINGTSGCTWSFTFTPQ